MLSNVLLTFKLSSGSFRKTKVIPFCFEKTNITNPDNRISDRVICNGIVNPDPAASGLGLANDGFVERKVFSGFACTLVFSVRYASPSYRTLNIPLNRSSAKSPISKISSDGGVEPRFSSFTRISSTMIGGLGDLFSEDVSICRTRSVSAISGDQLKWNAIVASVQQAL
jgi:hypothetical protein